MATVKVILRQDKVSVKTGKAPLYIRITQDRKSKFIALGIKIEPRYWNNEKSIIKRGVTNYKELNTYILQKRAEIEKASIELGMSSNNVSSKKIKEKIVGKKQINFFEYAEQKLEEYKKTFEYGSIFVYRNRLKKLENYLGNRDLNFSDIDTEFLNNYIKYQLEELNNAPNTVNGHLRFIKSILNKAIGEELIDYNIYNFKKINIKTKRPPIKYLDEEHFAKLLAYDIKKARTRTYYDMYIFSCYAGGLRFSDVATLKWNNFIESEQRIVKIIMKTKRKHQIKLPNKAIEILKSYKTKNSHKEDYIFPILKNEKDYKSVDGLINYDIALGNRASNDFFKRLSKKLEMPFNITFHTARHTFATRALNKGMRIEHVSKILDHSSISVTQVYAKVVNKELDKAMEIMND
jgi:integrase